MTDSIDDLAIASIRRWQGIEPPNAFAAAVIADLAAIVAAFEALEPGDFEAEPADFLRALDDLAER